MKRLNGDSRAYLPLNWAVMLALPIAFSGACNEHALSEVSPAAPPRQAEVDAAIAQLNSSDPDVALRGSPRSPRLPTNSLPFTRRQGNEVGIDAMGLLTPNQFSAPFSNGRGLAAGDVNKDGFQDVVIATNKGPKLYLNDSGKRFVKQALEIRSIDDLDVFNVVLLDINNDTWLDLFITTYMTGNHIVLSDRGRFSEAGWLKVADPPTVLTISIAFGDVDEDGDLDAYAGNWYYGVHHKIPPADSTNQLLIYDDGRFQSHPADEILGETLAVLLSDWNLDGHLDLIVGNDFHPPDHFYTGDGKGGFEMVDRTEEIIPVTTYSTMSIDTADYDNDLRLDIYIAGIADGVPAQHSRQARYDKQPWRAYCEKLNRETDREKCRAGILQNDFFEIGPNHRAKHVKRCKEVPEAEARKQCEAEMNLLTAVHTNRIELCDHIPSADEITKRRCEIFFKPGVRGTTRQYVEAIPQVKEQNVLLRANKYGRFDNVAEKLGVHITGWSWNAPFMDVDNDEWQDIYVVNGTWVARSYSTQKFFFRNLGGKRFVESAQEFGLQNFSIQSAFVMIDMENDGDLDLVVNDTHGPFWHYTNNESRNNSVLFGFRDQRANHFCIGCKVRIYYGPNGESAQIREVKLGGGYHSFNPPILHFGLGEHTSLNRVEVTWSTGEVTRFEGTLPANALYTLTRDN